MNEVNWLQQGWECPKCGAVMSPTTACCVNCRGNKGGSATTTVKPVITIEERWTGDDPALNEPSSICSTGSNESVVYGKEDSEVPWDIFQANV